MSARVAAALAGLLLSAASLSAQAQAYRLRAVHGHPHGTAVAVGLRLHAGSQDDEPGREGTAWMLGRILEAEATRALTGSAATVTMTVERATTLVTVLALPGDWVDVWATVDSVLFTAPLDPALTETVRAELLGRLSFEAGSPAEEFAREVPGLLTEPGGPFARSKRGTPTSVSAVTPDDVARYRGTYFRREKAVQSVVGPVALSLMPTPTPAVSAGAVDPPWLTGDRVVQIQDVTSTWIAVAYPVPTGMPRILQELLVQLLQEELDPTPPEPDRYSVDIRLVETPRGSVLVVEATVVPESTARWEGRITGAVLRLAQEPIPEDFFGWRRRRFRTARLMEESFPEAEAARMTADLLRDGQVRDLGLEIWGLDASSLGEAARALGEPRIFILGPDLGSPASGPR